VTIAAPGQSVNSHLKSQVSQLPNVAAEAGDAIAQEAGRFGELAKSWWQRNADVVRDARKRFATKQLAFGSRTRLYVKDEPVKSVLVAAAVGAAVTGLLMLLLKRDRLRSAQGANVGFACGLHVEAPPRCSDTCSSAATHGVLAIGTAQCVS